MSQTGTRTPRKAAEKPELGTRAELLGQARRLLLEKGYNGFSFQDLADHLRIRKASIHYYFASKTALLEDLITDFDRAFDEFMAECAPLPPDEKMRRYFRLFRRITEEGYLCPAGALSVDSSALPASCRKRLMEYQGKHRRWVRAVLEEGRGREFHRKIEPKEDSLLLGAALQGILQIARLHEAPVLVGQVIDSLERKILGGRS